MAFDTTDSTNEPICPHADCGYGECSTLRFVNGACEVHGNGEGRCQAEKNNNPEKSSLLGIYMDLSEAYNAIDEEVTRYQQEQVSAERALSNIAAIIADHESGDET